MQPHMTGDRRQHQLLDLPAHPSAAATKESADATFDGESTASAPRRRRLFFTPRVWDWLFVLVVLGGGTILVGFAFEPAKRHIDLKDVNLNKPIVNELVPSYALAILAVLSSIATFCVFEFPALRTAGWMPIFSVFYLGFVEACGMTLFVTNILKLIVGRPRPFFARLCKDFASDGLTCNGNGTKGVLSKISDARKSFPSGHSSLSFACFMYLTLYMAHKLHISHPGTTCRSAKFATLSIPLLVAALVSVSRLVDHHHFYADVLAGAVLGSGTAMAVWGTRKGEFEETRARVQEQTESDQISAVAGEFPSEGTGPGLV